MGVTDYTFPSLPHICSAPFLLEGLSKIVTINSVNHRLKDPQMQIRKLVASFPVVEQVILGIVEPLVFLGRLARTGTMWVKAHGGEKRFERTLQRLERLATFLDGEEIRTPSL